MASLKGSLRPKLRGQKAIPHSGGDLGAVIQQTLRLWHKHHLSYDQTKYVVESVRRRLELDPSHSRKRTVSRLDQSEVERLVQTTYRNHSKYGLMIKTLFQTGARVGEFVHIGVEDLLLDGDPPQIHIAHAKGGADRYVPVLIATCRSCRRWRRVAYPSSRTSKRISVREQPPYALFETYCTVDRHPMRPLRRHQETGLSTPFAAFNSHDSAGFRACTH
jgi:integrase